MQTLNSYEEEPGERKAWKIVLGASISFIGFVLLTHAFFVFLLFRQILPFWAEVAFSLLGGAIGAIGLLLRGNRGDKLFDPIALLIIGVISVVFVQFVSSQFGFIGIIVVGIVLMWWANKSHSRVD